MVQGKMISTPIGGCFWFKFLKRTWQLGKKPSKVPVFIIYSAKQMDFTALEGNLV